jgi:hypothetical protein
MKDIPFVKPEELEVARAMEKSVLGLPEEVVQFVGVHVAPSTEEGPVFHVTVGCPRSMEPSTCGLAVSMELRKRWPTETIAVSPFRGIVRAEKVDEGSNG